MEKLLTTRELAEAIGASESSLRRWTNSGVIGTSRTVGGHRRIPLSEAIRFIRETRATIVRPQVLGLADATPVGSVREGAEEAIRKALADGDAGAARGTMLSLYLGGTSLAALFDGPVARAMGAIGELWLHGPRGVLVEHRATDICLQAVGQLRGLLPPADAGAPAAVGGAPAGDPYLLPSLMCATVLADAGYRATNLGPDTPAEVLAVAAEEQEAAVVWLAASAAAAKGALQAAVESLARRLESRDVAILVGGREAASLNTARLPSVHVLATMSELAAFTRGAIRGRGAATIRGGQAGTA